MILRGVLDFDVIRNQDSNILFINECGGGGGGNLFRIPNGSMVILQRGKVKKRVRVVKGDASECDFSFASLSTSTARLFNVKEEQRYLLVFNEKTKIIRMFRSPVTRSNAEFKLDRNNLHGGSITLGGPFIDDFGIYSTRKTITVVRGNLCKTFAIRKSNVESFDLFFQLTAANASKFGLINGKSYRLAYNQITNRLVILEKI
ncbi:hypothetical protein ACP26L_12960 [Paenibacillus sp. S-38]|uniref:hypothetical protein n=1 Tax=Paenibacillus sp. S-38 TaxID=3416710 RepID=UPI003CECDDB8